MKKIFYILLFGGMAGAQAQMLSTHKTAVVHSQFKVASTAEAHASDTAKAYIRIDYYDGLGRPEQTVNYRQSPTGKDIVSSHLEYDNYDRIVKRYLPAPTSQSSGTFKTSIQGLASGFYGDNRPYESPKGSGTASGFDDSPLNRQLTTFGTGQAWADEDKNTTVSYAAAELEFRMNFELNAAGNIVINGSYPAGSLLKKTITDEQGNKRFEISDRWSRLVRTRTAEGIQPELASTVYVYDNKGRIGAVIQPEGVALSSGIAKDSPNWQKYVFAYEYDHRNRIIRKHIPGAGWTEYVYDKADRQVLQQDARQKTNNLWSFTKYTPFNEVAFTGEYENTNSRSSIQVAFDAYPDNPSEIWMGGGGYHGGSYPAAHNPDGSKVKNYYFYDQYDFVEGLNPGMAFKSSGAYHAVHSSAKGLVTGSVSYNQDIAGVYYMTALYYDDKNRLIQRQNTHPKTTNPLPDRTDYEYNFAGEVLREKRLYKTAGKADQTLITRHSYDHAGRLVKTYLSVNGQPEKEIIRYSYDEIGRLKNKVFIPNENFVLGNPDYIYRPPNPGNNQEDKARKAVILEPGTEISGVTHQSYLAEIDSLGGAGVPFSGLQTMNYQWHIRGGLTGINLNPSGNPVPDITQSDLFSYKLDYETANQWNGNIGKQSWNHVDGSNPVGVRNYTYGYDRVNRLKSASYSGLSGENYSVSGLNYDGNSNITSLQRYGKTGSSYGLMDNLNYTYNGNRLIKVTDAVSGDYEVDFVQRGSENYTYWENGALKSDENKEITNIVYNTFLNLPSEIYLTGGRWIKNTYLGDGTLVKREFSNGEVWEYNNGLIFKNDEFYSLDIPEGRMVYNDGNWQMEFYYEDHLGNKRVTFTGENGTLVKKDAVDFDAIGIVLQGTGISGAPENRFKYAGNESLSLFGLDVISDFNSRYLDRTLGRFMGVDMLGEHPNQVNKSPYAAFWNNFPNLTDPDGYCPTCPQGEEASRVYANGAVVTNKEGSWTWSGNNWLENTVVQQRSLSFTESWSQGNFAQRFTYGIADGLYSLVADKHLTGDGFDSYNDRINTKMSGFLMAYGPLARGTQGGMANAKKVAEATGAQYSVAYETTLAANLYPKVYRGSHFKVANISLNNAMASDATFASSMSSLGVTIPRSAAGSILGKSPSGWVWHHSTETGVMQLVPKTQHTIGSSFWNTLHPGGVGGFSIWGK